MTKYKIKMAYTFEGCFEVEADSIQEAKNDVEQHCSVTLGDVSSSLLDDTVDWDFDPHPVRAEVVDIIVPDGFYENDIEVIFVINNKAFVIDTADPLSSELERMTDIQNLVDPDNEFEYLGVELDIEKWSYLRKTITLVLVHLCELELSRLGCDVNADFYSGLSLCVDIDGEQEANYNYPVRLSDCYVNVHCDAQELYSQLKELNYTDLVPTSAHNIWRLPCLQNA